MADSRSEGPRRLDELMGREAERVAQLLAVLQREHGALKVRDSAVLGEVVAQKLTLMTELEGCGQERFELLRQAGFSADRDGLEAYLGRVEGTLRQRLLAGWEQLQEGLQQCRTQNQTNGMLLETSRHHVKKALAVLIGGHAPDVELYDKNGGISPENGAHAVVKV